MDGSACTGGRECILGKGAVTLVGTVGTACARIAGALSLPHADSSAKTSARLGRRSQHAFSSGQTVGRRGAPGTDKRGWQGKMAAGKLLPILGKAENWLFRKWFLGTKISDSQ